MLRERHADLFSSRAELLHTEDPPVWKRLVYPVVFGRRAFVPFALEARMQRTMMRRGLKLGRR
jgi:hypothetical protein